MSIIYRARHRRRRFDTLISWASEPMSKITSVIVTICTGLFFGAVIVAALII